MTNGSYPARLDLDAPLKVANWRPLVQWILAIPHLLVARALIALRGVLTLISLFTVLFTKQIPQSIFDMIVMTRRYSWRVATYALWMREPYPPFDFTLSAHDDGADPAALSVDHPVDLNRWLPLVKWLLAIPHYIVLALLYVGAIFVAIIGFFAVLFTGKWPEGLRGYLIGVSRWSLRVGAYAGLLTDQYPPFSLQDGTATTPAGGMGMAGGGQIPPPPAGTTEGPAVPPPPA